VRLLAVLSAVGIACAAASGAAAHPVVEPEISPARVPESPWKLPVAFTAWGFESASLVATDLAERLVASGIRSVAIQVDRDGPRASRADAAILASRGLDVYLWGIPDDGDHAAALEAFAGIVDGYIAQVEDDAQYAALLDNIEAGVGGGLPRAVVTTFEGINTTHNGLLRTPERMQPIVAAGITTAFVECYRQDHPSHGDLELMLWQAREYGWPEAVPVVGLYRGVRIGDYEGLDARAGSWGFWNVEQIHPDDWPVLEAKVGRGSTARG
jgi:hypothetical protein